MPPLLFSPEDPLVSDWWFLYICVCVCVCVCLCVFVVFVWLCVQNLLTAGLLLTE